MVYGTLHLRLSNGQTQSHNVGQSSILIGRGLANDLIINDPSVAPTHARLTFPRGEVVLEDLGSINGTYINGVRIEAQKPYVLKSAEMIRFGGVDALLAPANSAPPDWSAIAAAPPPPSLLTPQAEADSAVLPPPTPKLISIKLNPKRSTRDFTVNVTRSEDDPDSSTQTILLAGIDPGEDLTFAFRPQVIKLDPGQTKSSQLEVRGLPTTFTVTAAGKGKSYTSSTKGALVAPDRSMQVVAGIAAVLACFTGMFALAACPTTLRAVCGFVPANPVSMAVSTATFTPSLTPTDIPTSTPSPSATVAPTEPDASPTLSATGGPPATAVPTVPRPDFYGGGLLTFKLRQSNGQFSLMTLQQEGSPLVLIANKSDFRVLDYSSAQNLLAVDVFDGISHTLWFIRGDGAIVRESINEGWDTIRNADFASDGSFVVVDTLNAGIARYYIYAADGARLRDTVLLTPTATSTATRTPTASRTPTVTTTATNTRTATFTPSPTASQTASRTPTGTQTSTSTLTPSITWTASSTTTPGTATPTTAP